MRSYVVRRLLAVIPMIIGISLILFVAINLAPGGPESVFIAEEMSTELAAEIRRALGLDRPIHVRYWLWLKSAAVGDLGYSLTGGGIPVSTLIRERLVATLSLAAISLILSVVVAVIFGVLSAVFQYSWLDRTVAMLSYFGMSFPSFWLGIMLILFFSLYLGWLPASGYSEYGMEGNVLSRLKFFILPVITLSAIEVGTFVRFIRASMLEVLRQDYVRTAHAKGLGFYSVVFRHALRNALIPVVTVIGMASRSLIAGSVFVENIFGWPGLGRLAVMAVYRRDYAVVMGVNLMVALFVVLVNLTVDLIYTRLDPRITFD